MLSSLKIKLNCYYYALLCSTDSVILLQCTIITTSSNYSFTYHILTHDFLLVLETMRLAPLRRLPSLTYKKQDSAWPVTNNQNTILWAFSTAQTPTLARTHTYTHTHTHTHIHTHTWTSKEAKQNKSLTKWLTKFIFIFAASHKCIISVAEKKTENTWHTIRVSTPQEFECTFIHLHIISNHNLI